MTGPTSGKLMSEKPRFHKGLMTMETAAKMETRKHEEKLMHKGRVNKDYLTYKETEIRAEATKMKKKSALLKDDAQTMRRRLWSNNIVMVNGTYLEFASYKVIKEAETTRDLYLLHQVDEAKKAGLGVAIYDKKDNLLLGTDQGQLQDDDCMILIGRIITIHPLLKAKSAEIEKQTCVICFDEDIDSDLMFSVDSRCGHSFCVNCVKQHLAVKLLDGTLPNCLQQGCTTTKLSVDRCGKLLTPDMRLRWKEMTEEDSIPYSERVYCPYESCSYLMSRTKLVLASSCGHRHCLKCGGSFCFYCQAPCHCMLSCTDYKKLHPNIQNAKLISLANRNGWRQCGKCNHMVERSDGCRNMTCRCGNCFCYECGVGLNSSLVHSSRDDHVAQPRIMLESDATTLLLDIISVSMHFLCFIFFCFIMYNVLG